MHSPTLFNTSPLVEVGSIAAQSSFSSHPGERIARQLLHTEDESQSQPLPEQQYAVSPDTKPFVASATALHSHDFLQPLSTLFNGGGEKDMEWNSSARSLTSSSSEEENYAQGAAAMHAKKSFDASKNAAMTEPMGSPFLQQPKQFPKHSEASQQRSQRIQTLLSANKHQAQALAELQPLFESLNRDYAKVCEDSRAKSRVLRSLHAQNNAISEALRRLKATCALQAAQLHRFRTAPAEPSAACCSQLLDLQKESDALRRERAQLLEGHRLLRKEAEQLQAALTTAKATSEQQLQRERQEAMTKARAEIAEKAQLLALRETEVSREACRLEEGLHRFAVERSDAKEDAALLRWRLRELERVCEKKEATRLQLERALERAREEASEVAKAVEIERQAQAQRHCDLQVSWQAELREVRRLYEAAQADRARAEELLRGAHNEHNVALERKEKEKRELWQHASEAEWALRQELKAVRAALDTARQEASQHGLAATHAQREADAALRSKQLLENDLESLQTQLQAAELTKTQLTSKLALAHTRLREKEKEAEALRCIIEREWWARPQGALKREGGNAQADAPVLPLLWRDARSGSATFVEFTPPPERREERKDRARVAFSTSPESASAPFTCQERHQSTSDPPRRFASPPVPFGVQGGVTDEGEKFDEVDDRASRRPPSMMQPTGYGLPPSQQLHFSATSKEHRAARARGEGSRGLVESIERTSRRPSRGPSFSHSPHPYCVDETDKKVDVDDNSHGRPFYRLGTWDRTRRPHLRTRTDRYCESEDSEGNAGGLGASSWLHSGERYGWSASGPPFSPSSASVEGSPGVRRKSPNNRQHREAAVFFDPDVIDVFQRGFGKAAGQKQSPFQSALSGSLQESPTAAFPSSKGRLTRAGTPPLPPRHTPAEQRQADRQAHWAMRPHSNAENDDNEKSSEAKQFKKGKERTTERGDESGLERVVTSDGEGGANNVFHPLSMEANAVYGPPPAPAPFLSVVTEEDSLLRAASIAEDPRRTGLFPTEGLRATLENLAKRQHRLLRTVVTVDRGMDFAMLTQPNGADEMAKARSRTNTLVTATKGDDREGRHRAGGESRFRIEAMREKFEHS